MRPAFSMLLAGLAILGVVIAPAPAKDKDGKGPNRPMARAGAFVAKPTANSARPAKAGIAAVVRPPAIRDVPRRPDTAGPRKDEPRRDGPTRDTQQPSKPTVTHLPPIRQPGTTNPPKRPQGTATLDRPKNDWPKNDWPKNDWPNSAPPRVPRPPVLVLPLPPVAPPRPEASRPDPARPGATRPDAPRPPVALLPLAPPSRTSPTVTPSTGQPGATPPSSQPPAGAPPPAVATVPEFVPDEVLISLPLASPDTIETDVALAFNLTIVERINLSLVDQRLVRLRIPDRRAVPSVVAALQGDARVPAAQPNYIYLHQQGAVVQLAAAPSSAGMQYALAKIGLENQRGTGLHGRGLTVAVIDSGVERDHPDFAGQQIEEFDALDVGHASVRDPHGTSVTGIVAGRGVVTGVAPAVRILSVRAFGNTGTRASATAITSAILKGMTWSVENGARVINMSFAGVRDPAMERTIAALPARRVIAIAAAGNGGASAAPAFPAAYPEVIAVTATDATDKLYDKANQGRYIALAAPGVDVLVPAGRDEHELQSGTSFAAPHIAGIVALMLEVNPDLSVDHVRQILLAASDDLGRPGRDDQFGAGRINAAKAIAATVAVKPRLAVSP